LLRIGDAVFASEVFMEKSKMLVLSRKVGERIHIGDDVVVTITAIKGNRVQLGIDASHDVSILRGELLEFASQEAERLECIAPQEKQVA
jgi:carbon storage regulator